MSPAPIPEVKPGDRMPPFSKLKAMFAYDASEPLALKEDYPLTVSGVPLRQISYMAGGHAVKALLVVPKGKGPFPVVVYAPGWPSPVSIYYEDAAAMSREGYAALLIEHPMVDVKLQNAQSETRFTLRWATELRRGLDLLETLPAIDVGRIGFVGWSWGGEVGMLVAGVDDRIKDYVLMGVMGPMTTWSPEKGKWVTVPVSSEDKKYLAYEGISVPQGAARDRYVAQGIVTDFATYLNRNKGSAFLFLNGKDDSGTRYAKAFLAAVHRPTTLRIVAGEHTSSLDPEFWHTWMKTNL